MEISALVIVLLFQSAPLELVATIPLPGVSGRIDHLAYDAARQHLFVAALGNNTVEVLDTAKGQHLRSLPGFHEPQGVAAVADRNAIAVANGDTGTLQLIDATTFQTRWTVNIGGDADNVRYDAAARRIYVAAVGGLFAVDPATGGSLARVAIDGHPESFQLETAGTRVYANLPGLLSSQIVAGDRQSVTAAAVWPAGCGGNYPMALDESTSRLFVGCRRPARLEAIDTRTGKVTAATEVVGDTDDLFYDTVRRRVYVIGGEGFVDVVERQGDELRRAHRIPTRSGARTGLWVASLNRLYVAVPARGGDGAEVRVFQAMPAPSAPAIVFVCEHGAAKSVIATAYFNKLAAERGLPYRATFRGTDPQDALSVRAVAGLKADGVAIPAGAPTAIGAADIERATHIFAIGCTLPAAATASGKSKDWSDVPDDKGYEGQRDAIVRHVKELLDALQRRGK